MEVNARRDILVFVILVAVLSAPFYFVLFTGRAWTNLTSHIFMYVPAAAALITSRRELGFLRLGKPRHYAIAYAVPFAFVVPTYLITWLCGLGAFDMTRLRSMAASFHVPPAALIPIPLLLAPFGILNTLGEELGWSGLLTDRLLKITTFTRASLMRGAIWSLWHYPLVIVLLPRYRPMPVVYALACMTVAVTAISFVYTWLRLASGSIWPAALLHAVSSNFQDLCEALTRNTGPTPYITYEYGAGFAVILIFIAWYFRVDS